MRSHSRSRAILGIALMVLLAMGTVVPLQAASTAKASTQASSDNPVDLNKANVESLATVPGIGKVTAERIVQWREANGPFRRVEDLMKVKGIGDKTFDKLRPYIKVSKSR
jgi:competence protein ComEA